jgi:hypothetical protein
MAPLQFLVGTWHCSTTGTLNGKARKPLTTTLTIKPAGAWLDMIDSSQPTGFARFGYDKNNGKYVMVSTSPEGGYYIDPLTVQKGTITFGARSIANDTPDDIDSKGQLVLKSPSKIQYSGSGISASGKDKGKRYTSETVCTK